MYFRMIQAMIKCFERSTVERIEGNSNDMSAVYLYDNVLIIYINNSLHLARKYARIFVRGHYLFREANSFRTA